MNHRIPLFDTHAHRRVHQVAWILAVSLACQSLDVAALGQVRESSTGQAYGRVETADGKPLAGADLMLYYHHSWTGYGNEVVERVVSSEDGTFRFQTPLEYLHAGHGDYTDHYLILATHQDGGLAWVQILREKAQAPYQITMYSGMKQQFRVLDQEQQPIQGARVWLRYAGTRDDARAGFRTTISIPRDLDLVSGETDSDGLVTLAGLPATGWSCAASKSGFATQIIFQRGEAARLTGALKPAAKVSGRVATPTGKPIPGAVVWFRPDWIVGYYRRAETDSEGQYELNGLFGEAPNGAAAKYNVTLQHARFAAPERSVILEPGERSKPVSFEAKLGAIIHGKVIDPETKEPLPGARVQASSPSGRLNAYADEYGEFSWCSAPGNAHIYFTSPPPGVYIESNQRTTTRLALKRGVEHPVTISAPGRVGKLVNVTGLLLSDQGQPLGGIQVYPMSTIRFQSAGKHSYIHHTTTNADGTFAIEDIPTGGRLALFAETPDHNLVFAEIIDTPTSSGPLPDPLRMKAAAKADVLIQDKDGKPLRNQALKLRPRLSGRSPINYDREVKTDAEGRLVLEHVAPNVEYFIRDAAAEMFRSDWQEKFHEYRILVEVDPLP